MFSGSSFGLFNNPPRPNFSGFFYQIEKDGKTSYLLGSLHFTFQGAECLSAEVKEAFENSERLICEAYRVMDTPEQRDQFMHELTFGNEQVDVWFGKNIGEILDNCQMPYSPLQEQILALNSSTTNPPIKTFMEAKAAAILKKIDSTIASTLEQKLVFKANELSKSVFGLEKIEEITSAGYGLNLSYSEQLEVVECLLPELEEENIEDFVNKCTQLYLKGDIEELTPVLFGGLSTSIFTNTNLRKFTKELVHDRDHKQALEMEKYLNMGNSFIVIGCMHLLAVLKRLAANGYTIKPIKESSRMHLLSEGALRPEKAIVSKIEAENDSARIDDWNEALLGDHANDALSLWELPGTWLFGKPLKERELSNTMGHRVASPGSVFR